MNKLALLLVPSALQFGTAFATDDADPSMAMAKVQPDATVLLDGGSVAVGIGYIWGTVS